uniref:Uncharacterized protein n=1 Tax=Timema monikensis TaxID=170555 RepID=A0A7R9DZF2_9NEOP|nr:unnamed protein product [Timema monikensis]
MRFKHRNAVSLLVPVSLTLRVNASLGSPYGQQPPPSQSQQMYGGPGGDQRSSWGQPQPGPQQASQQAPATPQPSPQPPPPPQPSPHPPPSPNQQHPPPQQSPQHSQQPSFPSRPQQPSTPNAHAPDAGETKPCVQCSTFEALAQYYDGDCNRSSDAALKWSVTSPRFVVGSVSMAASAWLDTARAPRVQFPNGCSPPRPIFFTLPSPLGVTSRGLEYTPRERTIDQFTRLSDHATTQIRVIGLAAVVCDEPPQQAMSRML